MAPTRKSKDGLLARVNFPLYTIQMLTSRHVIVGGGGGSSKTGVANGFEIFELSHDGEKFVAEEVIRHETGPSVVMNCSAYSSGKHSYLVAGQESHCQLYNVQSILLNENENIETLNDEHQLRQRKNSIKHATANSKPHKKLKFLIKPSDSVQTDYDTEEPVQRVVRINRNGKFMATGGMDGIIRVWKFPHLEQLYELKVHNKEIDDLDFSINDNYLVTVAKDGLAVIWDYLKGKEIQKLTWSQPEGSKYLYKRCRFAAMEGEQTKNSLFMLANPTGLAKKQKSYLQKWCPIEGVIKKVAVIDESIAALAARDDGRFVAIGTMFSGSVSIYIAFSLQRVLHVPGAHSMFVTGLEFLPVVSDQHTITTVSEAAVLSISVDNQVCIHSLPYRTAIPAWIAIVVIIMTLFLTFLLCSYVGL